jgi:hypothetical protein
MIPSFEQKIHFVKISIERMKWVFPLRFEEKVALLPPIAGAIHESPLHRPCDFDFSFSPILRSVGLVSVCR